MSQRVVIDLHEDVGEDEFEAALESLLEDIPLEVTSEASEATSQPQWQARYDRRLRDRVGHQGRVRLRWEGPRQVVMEESVMSSLSQWWSCRLRHVLFDRLGGGTIHVRGERESWPVNRSRYRISYRRWL